VGLDPEFVTYLQDKQKKYSFESEKAVVFAINYGGRDEIIRGVKTFLDEHSLDELNEETLSKSLDFGELPPLDLVIRTKGNLARRTSGLMSWWIGYAELYFTDKKYPEFTVEEYQKALEWFNQVVEYRNFGK
jgi:undecaprenyl diphosphate synthase